VRGSNDVQAKGEGGLDSNLNASPDSIDCHVVSLFGQTREEFHRLPAHNSARLQVTPMKIVTQRNPSFSMKHAKLFQSLSFRLAGPIGGRGS